VTPAGVERLRAAAPKLEIVLGDEEPAAGESVAAREADRARARR
jgi:hypothetical protein